MPIGLVVFDAIALAQGSWNGSARTIVATRLLQASITSRATRRGTEGPAHGDPAYARRRLPDPAVT